MDLLVFTKKKIKTLKWISFSSKNINHKLENEFVSVLKKLHYIYKKISKFS